MKAKTYLFYVALMVLSYDSNGEVLPLPPGPEMPHRYPAPYILQGMDSTFKIARPSVFIFIRSREMWRDKELKYKIEAIVHTVNKIRSKEFHYDDSVLDPWTENIVLIEEEDHWVVTFHHRGNNMVFREAEGVYVNYEGFRPARVYHINKEGTKLIDAPTGAITLAPHITITLGLEFDTNYPDNNVDSFIDYKEAHRRNQEAYQREKIQSTGQP